MTTRAARAAVVTVLTLPAVVVAHLVVTGSPAGPLTLVVAGLAVALTAGTLTCARVGAASPGRLAATVALGQAAGHGVLAVTAAVAGGAGVAAQGCLPAVGRGAAAGLWLAGAAASPVGCPPGVEVPSSTLVAGAVSALLAAAVIVLGHALLAVLTARAVLAIQQVATAARAARRVANSAVAGLLHALRVCARGAGWGQPGPARAPGRDRQQRGVWGSGRSAAATPQWAPRAGVRRGPPVVAPA